MFDGVQGMFVRAVGDGEDPKSIPKHYVDYYNESLLLFRKFGAHQGIGEINENFWPLICLMADMKQTVEDLRLKVERLEKRHDAEASDNLQPSNLQPSTSSRVDGRTKEGKAMKAAQLVEA